MHGKVERIAPAAGNEFSIIKPDNATGNFVKVPQRITVRIAPDPDDPLYARLRPGMSVEARVDTRGGPEPRALQIGRASCRERVCQYVSISVVAVSLKKKHINRTKQNDNIMKKRKN